MALEPNSPLDLGFLAEHVGFQINLCRRGFIFMLRSLDESPGGKPSGYNSALVLIGRNPGITQKKVAAGLFLDPQALVLIIDKLEAAGLVTRARSATDRRRVELAATEAGHAEIAAIERSSDRHEDRIAALLTADERRDLLGTLNKLRARLAGAD